MADWCMSGDGQVHTAAGFGTAATTGTAVTTSGTAHTKGSWASLGASGSESGWLLVHLHGVSAWSAPGSPPAAVKCLLDIGFDAGTTTALIPDLLAYHPSALVGQPAAATLALPVHLPAGTTLYARAQAAAGTAVTARVSATTVACGWGTSAAGQRVEGWGTTAGASDGTTVAPGTAPSWGSYAQLTAATAHRCDWVVLAVACPGSFPAAGATHNYLIELAAGGSGSEQPLFVLPVTVNESGFVTQAYTPPLPAGVPAGTRLAVRATTSTTGPNLTVAAYGVG